MNALFFKAENVFCVSLVPWGDKALVSAYFLSICLHWLDATARPQSPHTDALIFLCAVFRDGAVSGMHLNHGLFLVEETRTVQGLISSQILPMLSTKSNKECASLVHRYECFSKAVWLATVSVVTDK